MPVFVRGDAPGHATSTPPTVDELAGNGWAVGEITAPGILEWVSPERHADEDIHESVIPQVVVDSFEWVVSAPPVVEPPVEMSSTPFVVHGGGNDLGDFRWDEPAGCFRFWDQADEYLTAVLTVPAAGEYTAVAKWRNGTSTPSQRVWQMGSGNDVPVTIPPTGTWLGDGRVTTSTVVDLPAGEFTYTIACLDGTPADLFTVEWLPGAHPTDPVLEGDNTPPPVDTPPPVVLPPAPAAGKLLLLCGTNADDVRNGWLAQHHINAQRLELWPNSTFENDDGHQHGIGFSSATDWIATCKQHGVAPIPMLNAGHDVDAEWYGNQVLSFLRRHGSEVPMVLIVNEAFAGTGRAQPFTADHYADCYLAARDKARAAGINTPLVLSVAGATWFGLDQWDARVRDRTRGQVDLVDIHPYGQGPNGQAFGGGRWGLDLVDYVHGYWGVDVIFTEYGATTQVHAESGDPVTPDQKRAMIAAAIGLASRPYVRLCGILDKNNYGDVDWAVDMNAWDPAAVAAGF